MPDPDEFYKVVHRRNPNFFGMLADNYLNLRMSTIDQHVYRIISVKRLTDLFQRRQNVLVRPKLWDDPFENFILNSYVMFKGRKGMWRTRDNLYGQCWTRHTASDAMWRIYSPDKDGVRIRSTPRRLAEALAAASAGYADVEAFIGAVRYLSQKMLYRCARELASRRAWEAESLLVKRLAFTHEREVRLIYLAQGDPRELGDLYAYPIDPHAMIDQIMIDPRQSVAEAQRTRDRIREATSFRGGILRSLLYAPPPKLMIDFFAESRFAGRRRREQYVPEHDPGGTWKKALETGFRHYAAMVPVGRKRKQKKARDTR